MRYMNIRALKNSMQNADSYNTLSRINNTEYCPSSYAVIVSNILIVSSITWDWIGLIEVSDAARV